jgi:lysophospholipase L1-like esterase
MGGEKKRTGPSTARKLFFSGLVLLGFFGFVEITLRIAGVAKPVNPVIVARSIDVDIDFPFMQADADLFWSPIPEYRGEFLGQTVTINSLGLRGPEVEIPKPRTKRRVLCFGDSITFGYGVGDDETYASRLGRALAPRGVEVVNCGVTGFTSFQVKRLFSRVSPQLEPDVAVFCVGWNDASRRPVDDHAYARRVSIAAWMEGLSDYWYLYRLAKGVYLRSFEHEWEERPLGPRAAPADYRENLETIVGMCRSDGVVPVFIDLPRRKKEKEERFRSVYSDTLKEVGGELGIPVIDPGELGLETSLPSNERYFIDTLHFSPDGHTYLAHKLARDLEALGIL